MQYWPSLNSSIHSGNFGVKILNLVPISFAFDWFQELFYTIQTFFMDTFWANGSKKNEGVGIIVYWVKLMVLTCPNYFRYLEICKP